LCYDEKNKDSQKTSVSTFFFPKFFSFIFILFLFFIYFIFIQQVMLFFPNRMKNCDLTPEGTLMIIQTLLWNRNHYNASIKEIESFLFFLFLIFFKNNNK